MSASPSGIAGEFAGRYTVEDELGRGASAVVYRAKDLEYGRVVAIKVLRPELAQTLSAERFLREIRITAQLHHPHILPILHSGDDNGRLYCVLPFMDGGTLRSRLQRDKQLPIADAISIGCTIAGALAAAHARGLLHRDVKPENILFTGDEACLADFGIARAVVESLGDSTTSTGIVRGTPAYMSPEQASGDRDYDGRSDLYSLACVIYEAIAGVPAFIGATSQAVVSQRLVHPPRPIRVYRPSATPELEAVLEKALATSPADRYQTAAEFAEALADVPFAPTRNAQAVRRPVRRSALLVGASVVVAVALAIAGRDRIAALAERGITLDTTRVAILPFDGTDSQRDSARAEDLLAEGLRRWNGLKLVEGFEIGDAIRRVGSPATVEASRRIAKGLGAGRFVRGHVASVGASRRISAQLFDTRSGARLHEVTLVVPRDSSATVATYGQLADSVVLRSQRFAMSTDPRVSTTSLPATQVMLRADHALRDWNLALADSLYADALHLDPGSSRAAFWVAQLRAWRGQPSESWAEFAHRAAADSIALGGDERQLAVALAALGDADYPRACQVYDAMRMNAPRQFVGWYGLGECLRLDRVVVADSAAPSGWRFRSSQQSAIDAYVRAFELLPSVYVSYQGDAYSRLRNLLYTNTRYRRAGKSLGPNASDFIATPTLAGDTLAFVPQPIRETNAGRSIVDPKAAAAAVIRTRALFRRITSGWAAAFPTSPGTKEGLAVSMEVQGDPASIDTARAALRLSREPSQRLRLMGSLLWLQLKFAVPDRTADLLGIRKSADSILNGPVALDRSDADVAARMAAFTGHCAVLARASERAAPLAGPVGVPRRAAASADVRMVLQTMGCRIPDSLPSLDRVEADAALGLQSEQVRQAVERLLFLRIVRSADSLDMRWAERLAATGDFVILCRLMIARGRADSARQRMDTIQAHRRLAMPGDFTPDAALPESRVWLAIGDTAKAVQWLDRSLSASRYMPPLDALEPADNIALIASMVRAMALRAELPGSARERARWANAVVALWGDADEELQPLVRRMREIARSTK